MKALLLAAGFGTRLKPYTDHTPKALFPFMGRPLLDKIIRDLCHGGCSGVMVNTHHLGSRIETFLSQQQYPIPVFVRHEPQILGTGGGIANMADFLDGEPFMVVNSDIVTDVDYKTVYRFHLRHNHSATLVLTNSPRLNTVTVGEDGTVLSFHRAEEPSPAPAGNILTFTGIQVLDPSCLVFFPRGRFSSSIDAYEKMMGSGLTIQAYVSDSSQWTDVGTPERFKTAVIKPMADAAFQRAFDDNPASEIETEALKGDGSDRKWFRMRTGERSLILVDHGIREALAVSEVDAFIDIGRHLYDHCLPVPKIVLFDRFSGLVFLEDLGEAHLADVVRRERKNRAVVAIYEHIIDELIRLSQEGARGFDPHWAYQTPVYDENVVIERECRYFVESFLNDFLNVPVGFHDLEEEFAGLAEQAIGLGVAGFMHRDFQSRNIMIKKGRCRFIDFQGGRIGPIQYDLASLLIDPYVDLSPDVRNHLLQYGIDAMASTMAVDREAFVSGFRYCALARNLQILGAFSFLSKIKGKNGFQQYIPAALDSLRRILSGFDRHEFPVLRRTVKSLDTNVTESF